MARLPQPGGDAGNWGAILNDYLAQSHAADGMLKSGSVGASQLRDKSVTAAHIIDGSISTSHLTDNVQISLARADSAYQRPAEGVPLADLNRTDIDTAYASKSSLGFDVILEGDNPSADPVVYRDADVQAAFNSRRARLGPGVYHVSGQIRADSGCEVVLDGATIVSHYTSGRAIEQTGTTPDESVRDITSGATKGSSVLTTTTAGLDVGDWILATSGDKQENDTITDRFAAVLRQVTAVDITTITIDAPLYKDMTTSPRCVKVVLAPPMTIAGTGVIRAAVPASTKRALVRSILGHSPHLGPGVTLGPSGGPGFEPTHTVNALSEATFVDLIDNGANGNNGYAVNDGSASRNTRVLGGSATRVRHGYTTNNGAVETIHSGLGAGIYGEPEDAYVGGGFAVYESGHQAFDTHECGRRIVQEVIAINCQQGLVARAYDCTFIIKSIVSPTLYAAHVADSAVNTVIANLSVVGCRPGVPSGAAVLRLRAPVTLVSPNVYEAPPSPWQGVKAETDRECPVTIVGGGYIAGTVKATRQCRSQVWTDQRH
ncbi:hypothetical protein R4227_18555 [Gordonia amicalis]|uniref:hypothetical protein n=1 Tax=Gordonia amicalis TaxID=89053 RepID=UPI0029532AE6|nr:hypothetical protein [Gordonia amicalis]MDV7102063.1 hypothetical protein [Gordonia amicalis]